MVDPFVPMRGTPGNSRSLRCSGGAGPWFRMRRADARADARARDRNEAAHTASWPFFPPFEPAAQDPGRGRSQPHVAARSAIWKRVLAPKAKPEPEQPGSFLPNDAAAKAGLNR